MIFNKYDLGSLKSLLILEAMSHSNGYIGINEICEITGYNQSTVHRILNEMLQCGFVEKNDVLRKYKLGMEAVIMASRFMHGNSLVTISRSEMLALNQETTETVHLLSITGHEVIYLSKIDAHHSVGLLSTVGKRNPIYCTSGGKAMAAFMGEEWIEDYLRVARLEPLTPTTLTTPEDFRKEMAAIRRSGFALDRQEHHSNIVCIGAPIFDYSNRPIASISVAAPSYRFPPEKALSLSGRIMESARNISRQLGANVK